MTPKSKTSAYASRYAKLHRSGYRTTVPVLGYTRRLQALMAIGYTRGRLEEATGLPRASIQQILHARHPHITLRTARAISDAYDRLCGTPLTDTNGNRARTWARKQGWVPPGSWDDIDDRRERPKGARWPDRCVVKGCPSHDNQRQGRCHKHYEQIRKHGRIVSV